MLTAISTTLLLHPRGSHRRARAPVWQVPAITSAPSSPPATC